MKVYVYFSSDYFSDFACGYWLDCNTYEAIEKINRLKPMINFDALVKIGFPMLRKETSTEWGIERLAKVDYRICGKIVGGTRYSYSKTNHHFGNEYEVIQLILDCGFNLKVEVRLPNEEYKFPFELGTWVSFTATLQGRTYWDGSFYSASIAGKVSSVDFLGTDLGAIIEIVDLENLDLTTISPTPHWIGFPKDLFLSDQRSTFAHDGKKLIHYKSEGVPRITKENFKTLSSQQNDI